MKDREWIGPNGFRGWFTPGFDPNKHSTGVWKMADRQQCDVCKGLYELPKYNCGMLGCPYADRPTIVTLTKREAERDPLLQEREKTHGSFQMNADISSSLKVIFREHNEKILSSVHREALDMIALKLSRILSGQANFKDHWDDIAGYAKLAAEACQK